METNGGITIIWLKFQSQILLFGTKQFPLQTHSIAVNLFCHLAIFLIGSETMKLFHPSVSCSFGKIHRASISPIISLILFLLATIIILPSFSSAEVKKEYYPGGKLKSEQNYIKDKLEGTGKGYYESGKLQWEENYKNGKLEGIARGYYESGKLQAEANFKNGKKDGTLKVYYESGEIKLIETYKNGKKIDSKEYDKSGNLNIDLGVSL